MSSALLVLDLALISLKQKRACIVVQKSLGRIDFANTVVQTTEFAFMFSRLNCKSLSPNLIVDFNGPDFVVSFLTVCLRLINNPVVKLRPLPQQPNRLSMILNTVVLRSFGDLKWLLQLPNVSFPFIYISLFINKFPAITMYGSPLKLYIC